MAEPIALDIPDELKIPLPPSASGSEYGDDIEDPMTAEPRGQSTVLPVVQHGAIPKEEEESNTKRSGGLPSGSLSPFRRVASLEQAATPGDAGVTRSLDNLIHMLRDDAYQTRRLKTLQDHIQDLMTYCHNAGSLIPRQSHLYRLMVRCLKTDHSTAFASLYTQAVQLRESHTIIHKLTETPLPSYSPLVPFPGPQLSWLHTLSPDVQRSIVRLLHRIRSKPDFLASRMASLSSSQLSKLAQPHRQAAVQESVLRHSTAGSPFLGGPGIRLVKAGEDHELHNNLSLEHDPLFLLLYRVFPSTRASDASERSRRCDIWSSTCAHMIEEGKADPDEFCMAILDEFANMTSWSIAPQLEVFLRELMQSGAFILELPDEQHIDFTRSGEISGASQNTNKVAYFDNALKSLTQLLTSGPSRDSMPEDALNMIHAVLRKIKDPEKNSKAQKFFVRWYCTSFMSSALICPESRGIMLDSHISSGVRQNIFHELAVRFQNCVFDALSLRNSTLSTSTETENNVTKLLECFTPSLSSSSVAKSPVPGISMISTTNYMLLSPNDVLSIVKILNSDSVSHFPTHDSFDRTSLSKASSVTGLSTLTLGTDEPRTGTASSTAASETGTSMTSDGSSAHIYMGGLYGTRKDSQSSGRYISISSSSVDETETVDEHSMDLMVLELSRLISHHKDSTITPRITLNKHAVFYVGHNGDSVSLNSEPFERDLMEVNRSVELLKTKKLITYLSSENDLSHLVEGLVRLSQTEGMDYILRDDTPRACSDIVEARFHDQVVLSDARYDFQSSHFWWRCLNIMKQLEPGHREALFMDFDTVCQTRNAFMKQAIKHFEGWRSVLQWEQMRYDNETEKVTNECGRLRDKMWFSSGVKYSSTYQDALNVTRTLRSMSKTSQAKSTGMAAWARQRIRSSIGSDRARQQALQVLAASEAHGGPSKMSDDQVEMTSRWLTRQSVENFCKGEERLHRFCLEIQKCVNKLVGETILDSPFLWSSSLYQHEKYYYGVGHGQPAIQTGNKYPSWKRTAISTSFPSSGHSMPFMPFPSNDTAANFHGSGRAYTFDPNYRVFGSHLHGILGQDSSITIDTHHHDDKSSTMFQTPTLPPSPVSPISKVATPMPIADSPALASKQRFLTQLRETLTSLLLSELGSDLWNEGSETDRWINNARIDAANNLSLSASSPLSFSAENGMHSWSQAESGSASGEGKSQSSTIKGMVAAEHSVAKSTSVEVESQSSTPKTGFPFREAYTRILTKFRLSSNPFDKLRLLNELTALIATSENSQRHHKSLLKSDYPTHNLASPRIKALGVPRTRLTRLEEVTANCEERRLQSMMSHSNLGRTYGSSTWDFRSPTINGTASDILPLLQTMLRDSNLRPHTLFRDLQYIAAFVPSSILDETPLGTAFWTVGLAAITLKSELSSQLTHRANLIVAYHYTHQPKRDNAVSAEPQRASLGDSTKPTVAGLDDPSLQTTNLADAARLYTISALEGDPIAARELALFHLTHPELVRRVTLPFSRPGEVFRSASTSAGNAKEGQARGGLDPMAFAVAFHWMEVAANAGDRDARAFLRENGDLGKGW
ncbi:hypothetical protein MMC13_002259 [Lambiella insularis]|nr:hypothetical protein [Lambiella insularis]